VILRLPLPHVDCATSVLARTLLTLVVIQVSLPFLLRSVLEALGTKFHPSILISWPTSAPAYNLGRAPGSVTVVLAMIKF
jgi:hypothetical protein